MSGSRHTYAYFVNRRAEIREFERLLADNECRLLFIRGPRGIGKSGLLHFLIRTYRDQPMVQAFVDFGGKTPIGKRREALIYELGRQLRGPFQDLLEELDKGMPEAPRTSARDRYPENGGPRFDAGQIADAISESVAKSIASAGPTRQTAPIAISPGSGAFVGGNVQAQRDFIGRDKVDVTVTIDTIAVETPPDPGGGIAKAAERWERRTNRIFRDALQNLLATNHVVLYFDHCEKSKPAISNWLSDELVNEFNEPLQDTSQLRIVLVGSKVPCQELASKSDPILSDLELKGLELQYVQEFWVEKLGLEPDEVADVMRASGGVPILLWQEVETRRKQSGDG